MKDLEYIKKFDDNEIMRKLLEGIQGENKLLFVFDNLDALIQQDEKNLRNYLNRLVTEKENLQILFSTGVYLGGLSSFVVKNLKGLNPKQARDLFIARIPSQESKDNLFNQKELENLKNITVEDEYLEKICDLLNMNPEKINQKNKFCRKPCTLH